MPDVRDFEPRMALDGGDDGLVFYRKIVEKLPEYLVPGGVVAVEVGAGQAPDVAELFARAGLSDIESRKDLAHIERVVSARRPSP
jgi:release factor glutamine methyltransferase